MGSKNVLRPFLACWGVPLISNGFFVNCHPGAAGVSWPDHMGVKMRITVEGSRAVFTGEVTPALLAVMPMLEGHKVWAKDRRSFRFDASAYNLGMLENAVGAVIDKPDEAVLSAFAPDAKTIRTDQRWKSATEPMDHQIEGEQFTGDKKNIALFMEQGTGKTKLIIDWSHYLFETGQITGHLVISKKGAHRQWIEEEYPKHYAGEFVGQFWPFNHTDPAILQRGGELKILSVNWDGQKTPKGKAAILEFVRVHRGKLLITADESQEMKNAKSARSKAIREYKAYSSHRALASGTPIAVDLTDEWAQLNWLDENILGIKYVTTFRAEYCQMGGFQGKQVVGHRNVDQFRKLTAPFVFRVTKEEIGIAPPVFSAWRFDLTPDQLRMMREIRKDLETRMDNGEIITVQNVLATFGKMSQIASGFIYDENKNAKLIMPLDKNPRIEKMLEWADWVGDRRMLIWHRFTAERQMIIDALKDAGIPTLDFAGMKESEWAEAKAEFRSPGGALALIGNPQSGLGTGQNLQGACNNALYYSHADRLIDRLQSQDRILRIGTKGIVTFSDLVGRASPDVRIISNNRRKQGIAEMGIGGLRELLAEMAAQDR